MYTNYSQSLEHAFYHKLLDVLHDRYPAMHRHGIGMVKVLHAFKDKLPLVEVLLERGLLYGLMLKKSSSDAQHETVETLVEMAKAGGILLDRSETTYAEALPSLSRTTRMRPFILGDHGGYYSHMLPYLSSTLGDRLIGVTEHTLNGEIRNTSNIPLLSTAQNDLKFRSDRHIAYAIADEIVRLMRYNSEKSFFDQMHPPVVLVVGYGIMGSHIASRLKESHNHLPILILDKNARKQTFAYQDGYTIVPSGLNQALLHADIIILATNTIKGKTPVFQPHHFGLLKKGAIVTSVTSAEDELDHITRIEEGTIKPIGQEAASTIYQTTAGNRFGLLLDGRPTNVMLATGGADASIHMVEAAGLAGSFVLAECRDRQCAIPQGLPDNVTDLIASLWLDHFKPKELTISRAPEV